MSVLVLEEKKELYTAGRELADALGTSLETVVLGNDSTGEEAAKYADRVYVAKHGELADYRTLTYTRVLADLIGKTGPEVVLMEDNLISRDYAPRLAARLDAELTMGVTRLALEGGKLRMTKPVLGERRIHTYETSAWPALVGVKPGNYDAATPGGAGTVEDYAVSFDEADLVQRVLEGAAPGGSADLSSAKVIISIGGGIRKDMERGKQLAMELAGLLRGAVGASRVVTDAGWIERERQIGQTGQIVSPDLYIACGISGQIQHLAGMRNSKVIIAVNTDPEAPIMRVADYAIVGDLFEVLPVLIRKVKDQA